jgi:hypothetical protein
MAEDTKTGGAAFPSPGIVIDERSHQRQQGAYEGMSLRDYFAAEAVNALIGGHMSDGTRLATSDFPKFALAAYMLADEMLKARAQ